MSCPGSLSWSFRCGLIADAEAFVCLLGMSSWKGFTLLRILLGGAGASPLAVAPAKFISAARWKARMAMMGVQDCQSESTAMTVTLKCRVAGHSDSTLRPSQTSPNATSAAPKPASHAIARCTRTKAARRTSCERRTGPKRKTHLLRRSRRRRSHVRAVPKTS